MARGFGDRGGGGGRGGRGFGGARGGSSGFRGRGGYSVETDPPEQIQEVGVFMNAAEGDLVYKVTTSGSVPRFNAFVYTENKAKVGKIDEILGNTTDIMFSVKPVPGVQAASINEGDKVFISTTQFSPLRMFTDPPKPRGRGGSGRAGGGRGAFGGGGGPGRGRGSFGGGGGGGGGGGRGRGRGRGADAGARVGGFRGSGRGSFGGGRGFANPARGGY